MDIINAAIIGAGFIAETHAQVLRELNVNVVLIVDQDIKKAEDFAGRHNIPSFSDQEEDLFTCHPDVVHICTPPSHHTELIRKLFKNGIHVFCEKPLCFSSEDALELQALSQNADVLSAVGFNVRFHEGVQNLRKRLQNNFGDIRLIQASYLQEFNVLPCPYGWRFDPQVAGRMRAVTEIGSHTLDLIEYVTGKRIQKVSAVFSTFIEDRTLKEGMMYAGGNDIHVTNEDAAIITFITEDHIIGSVVLNEASPGRTNFLSIEITGDRETLMWNAEEINTIRTGRHAQGITTETLPFAGGFADSQRRMFTNFYEALRTGKTTDYPSISAGARNVLLTNAVYESAVNEGRFITVGKE